MFWFIVITFLVLNAVGLWACCVVAGQTDDLLEEIYARQQYLNKLEGK